MTFSGALVVTVGLALVWGGVACDAPVKHAGDIPPGQIESRSLAIPVDGIVGPQPSCPITCNDQNPCTDDACVDGLCEHFPNTAACGDTDPCTFNERCSNSKCVVQTVSCRDDACNTRVCNGTAICKVTPKTGQSCSDNDLCTFGEACDANGACSGGKAIVCKEDACTTRSCNGTNTCAVAPKTGQACNDGNACTYSDSCDSNGTCRPGTAIVCQDDACNTRVCNGTSACKVTPRTGAACSDGDACTFGDACDAAGICQRGGAVSCVSDACNTRTCNGTATCKVTSRAGNRCDDGKPCSFDDICRRDGSCGGTAAGLHQRRDRRTKLQRRPDLHGQAEAGRGLRRRQSVHPGRRSPRRWVLPGHGLQLCVGTCLISSVCDGKGGCKSVSKPDETACDADKSLCTPKDVCRGGVCVPDPRPVKCVERDCNTVACNAQSGNCEYLPTSGDACGLSGCFTAGTCQNGVCSGRAKDCSAMASACTEGLCDAATGECVAAPKNNGSDCSPGGACSHAASCSFGVCELPPAACPVPSSPCMVAACDPGDGRCIETARPAGAPCDPKNSCISDAVCDAQGACVGTPASNGDPCTAEGGQIGQCVSSSCVARSGTGATPPPPAPDAGVDAPGTTGEPLPTSPPPPQKSGCAVAGAGLGSTQPQGGAAWATLLALALGLALGRRRDAGR